MVVSPKITLPLKLHCRFCQPPKIFSNTSKRPPAEQFNLSEPR